MNDLTIFHLLRNKQNVGPLESSIIVLHDVIPEDVEAILSYIYRGQCLVSKVQISRLVHLAKALKIQGLCNMKLQDQDANFQNEECELENTQIEIPKLSDETEKVRKESDPDSQGKISSN